MDDIKTVQELLIIPAETLNKAVRELLMETAHIPSSEVSGLVDEILKTRETNKP